MTNFPPCHIVQISHDKAVFLPEKDSEPLARQLSYGRELERIVPGSRMTLLVLTQDTTMTTHVKGNVVFVPCSGGKIMGRLKIWTALTKLHAERPIDVITTQTIFDEALIALVFAWMNGCRVVGQIHFDIFSDTATRMQFGAGLLGKLRLKTSLMLLKKFYALRVVGKRIRDRIAENRLHFQTAVLPVPMSLVADHGSRQERKNTIHKILYVGRLSREKNLHQWLQIAALVARNNDTVEFHLIGDGSEKEILQSVAEELGISSRIHLHGYVPNEQLAEHYRSAQLFLLTSHFEGFGRVVVEALAHGTPVVAPRITGVEDIVEQGKSGYLHEPGDIEGMAQSTLRLLDDPDLAARMGEAGRTSVLERYSPDKLTRDWITFLVEAVCNLPQQVLLPKRRTWSRWRKIGFSKYTLLRSIEYETIRGLILEGKTLDVGGGRINSYYDLLDIRGSIDSVNISPEVKPTLLADLNCPLPIASETYDNIISLNTFEHVYNHTLAIAESLRVLKTGGTFHFVVPFLYQVHGSYGDYHRNSSHWWIAFLLSQGIQADSFTIEPLVWDRISSAYSFIGHGRVGVVIKRLVTFPAVMKDLHYSGMERLPNRGFAHRILDVSLGYYISGRK